MIYLRGSRKTTRSNRKLNDINATRLLLGYLLGCYSVAPPPTRLVYFLEVKPTQLLRGPCVRSPLYYVEGQAPPVGVWGLPPMIYGFISSLIRRYSWRSSPIRLEMNSGVLVASFATSTMRSAIWDNVLPASRPRCSGGGRFRSNTISAAANAVCASTKTTAIVTSLTAAIGRLETVAGPRTRQGTAYPHMEGKILGRLRL
jgi:hypothetical protein